MSTAKRRPGLAALGALCWVALVAVPGAALAPRKGLAARPGGCALRRWAPPLRARGGGVADDDEDEDEDEAFEDDDDVDDSVFEDDGVFEDGVTDGDFEGDTFKARTLKAWAQTPPMTQAYVGASLALTMGSFALFNNRWPEWLYLDWSAVLGKGHLWRVRRVLRNAYVKRKKRESEEELVLPPQSERTRVECIFYRLTSVAPPVSPSRR